MGDITRLDKLGLLGPALLLLHMGWVDARKLHLLAKHDVKISLAPSASMHQAMGNISHGKTPEMLELGLALSLGSDSAMSSNYLDAIRQAFLIVGGLHEARLDPKVLLPETAVEMLTINGARCICHYASAVLSSSVITGPSTDDEYGEVRGYAIGNLL
jgi:5-methylthioadenosine/S-adenosylhomocysteine deaminase